MSGTCNVDTTGEDSYPRCFAVLCFAGAEFTSVQFQAKAEVKMENIINESNKLVSQFIAEGLKCQSAFDVVDPN